MKEALDCYYSWEDDFVGHLHQFEQQAAAGLQSKVLAQVIDLVIELSMHSQLLDRPHKSKVYKRQLTPPSVSPWYTKACLEIEDTLEGQHDPHIDDLPQHVSHLPQFEQRVELEQVVEQEQVAEWEHEVDWASHLEAAIESAYPPV